MTTDKKIVLFDGVCNLCNGAVRFIIKRDKKNQFLFASLQGDTGRQLLERYKLPVNALNSFVLVERERAYLKSTGALRVLKHLGGGWALLFFLIAVPAFIRNGIYDRVAANRYRWFGRTDECRVPTPEEKSRFLE